MLLGRCEGVANFGELRKAEFQLPRIRLLRTPVNRLISRSGTGSELRPHSRNEHRHKGNYDRPRNCGCYRPPERRVAFHVGRVVRKRAPATTIRIGRNKERPDLGLLSWRTSRGALVRVYNSLATDQSPARVVLCTRAELG